MNEQELRGLALFAGTAEMAQSEVVRIRAQSLTLTISQIRHVRSLLTTLEADASAQERELRVALQASKRVLE